MFFLLLDLILTTYCSTPLSFQNPYFAPVTLHTDGGFAAAHAWLSRHSTDSNLDSDPLTPSSVLVNYDPKESTAAKMERAKNASSAERTQAKLQVFLDNSSKEQ